MLSRPLVVLALGVLLAACSSSTPVGSSGSVEPTSTASAPSTPASATTEASDPSSQRPAACPNPNGGVCLGPLAAGTYTTKLFEPELTYAVPSGWDNEEDLPGNFLLLPPEATLEGVDAGADDYIGLYTQVKAADEECAEIPAAGVGRTPSAIADWIGTLPGVVATEPEPTEVGGLGGLVLDIRLAEDWTGTCPFAEGMPVVPLLIGAPPSGLHHVIPGTTGFVMRLYLLEFRGGSLAIEIQEVHDGRDLDELSDLAERFEFE